MSAATTQFPTATILAYPRIGRGRELKRALEARWAGRITEAELIQAANDLRKENLARLVELGLNPSDALAQDDPNNPDARRYVNLFVAQKDKVNNETYKKVVEIFHSKTVQDAVKEDSKNTAVEVNLSQDELKKALENEEAALKK